VKRVFSAMHIVKNRLRNRMWDKWINGNLVVYIEKDIFNKIDNKINYETVLKYENLKKTTIM
jgi:hypothetical protein